MPRRSYKKRKIKLDPIYKSRETAKLINYLMHDGKRSTASRLVYLTFEMIKKQKQNPLEALYKAIENVAPAFEVKPKRVGGASYLVPTETRSSRKIFLALNWIINAALARSNKEYKSFDKKLFSEITDACNNRGEAVNKKRQVEKLAEANRAFAHFKW